MAELYSHNKMCDVKNWAGELALEGFEEVVFADEIMEEPIFNAYETAIENFWPLFISDASLE